MDEQYMAPGRTLAKLLAKEGHTMVYGASEYGMMKLMADGVQQAGGKVIGVTSDFYKTYARKNADELVVAKTLGERRMIMIERSAVIVVMTGGLGTLDELTEALELKKQNQHNKPIIVLNTAGFYDGLKLQLQHIADEGFLPKVEQEGITIKSLDQYIRFVDTPQQVMALIERI